MQIRIIFRIGIFTAMRPTALYSLQIDHFDKVRIPGVTVWEKLAYSGVQMEAQRLLVVFSIKSMSMLLTFSCGTSLTITGNLFFKYITEYVKVRWYVVWSCERFFMTVKPTQPFRITPERKHFSNLRLSGKVFYGIFMSVCQANVSAHRVKSWVSTHGLRGTLATLLY